MFFIRLCAILLFATSALAATGDEERDLTKLRTLGFPGGDSVYIFTSAVCPHCATFHREVLPALIDKYVTSGKGQIFFVDDTDTSPALEASMLARCLPMKQSEQFMTKVFTKQRDWIGQKDAIDRLIRYAVTSGFTRKQAQKCVADIELQRSMKNQWTNLARVYNIRYFPTVAVRRGDIVKTYTGANKNILLKGIELDFPE